MTKDEDTPVKFVGLALFLGVAPRTPCQSTRTPASACFPCSVSTATVTCEEVSPPITPLPRPLKKSQKPPHRHSNSESKALKITSHLDILVPTCFLSAVTLPKPITCSTLVIFNFEIYRTTVQYIIDAFCFIWAKSEQYCNSYGQNMIHQSNWDG